MGKACSTGSTCERLNCAVQTVCLQFSDDVFKQCRQMQMPVFPVHVSGSAGGAQSTLIQHPSPMYTPYKPQGLRNTPMSDAPTQAPLSVENMIPANEVGWQRSAAVVKPNPSQHLTDGPSQRAASLPSGFVPLQPVSTTEVGINSCEIAT